MNYYLLSTNAYCLFQARNWLTQMAPLNVQISGRLQELGLLWCLWLSCNALQLRQEVVASCTELQDVETDESKLMKLIRTTYDGSSHYGNQFVWEWFDFRYTDHMSAKPTDSTSLANGLLFNLYARPTYAAKLQVHSFGWVHSICTCQIESASSMDSRCLTVLYLLALNCWKQSIRQWKVYSLLFSG